MAWERRIDGDGEEKGGGGEGDKRRQEPCIHEDMLSMVKYFKFFTVCMTPNPITKSSKIMT